MVWLLKSFFPVNLGLWLAWILKTVFYVVSITVNKKIVLFQRSAVISMIVRKKNPRKLYQESLEAKTLRIEPIHNRITSGS